MRSKIKWSIKHIIPGGSPSELGVEHGRECIDARTFVKKVIEKSSSDMVTAIKNPENTPDLISGHVILEKRHRAVSHRGLKAASAKCTVCLI